jgi:hypothetical protein
MFWPIIGIVTVVGYLTLKGYATNLQRRACRQLRDTRRAALNGHSAAVLRWNNDLLPLGRELVAKAEAGDSRASDFLSLCRMYDVFTKESMQPIPLTGTVRIAPVRTPTHRRT